ncbi:hypothetical protein [Spirillospora sp. NBC_01491]|uniref:hypothetical protein n=1 Tax=Spirillospora sp. NBC_01491 TaxID=2976007 RepID=UPI002E33813A|nr:hypothetical protein [Spirillospora sp. NBC_01491]
MIAAVRALARLLLGPTDPHQCIACAWFTRRLTPEQRAQVRAGHAPRCPWCGGRVFNVPARGAS